MAFVSQTFLPVQQFRGVKQELSSFLGNGNLILCGMGVGMGWVL